MTWTASLEEALPVVKVGLTQQQLDALLSFAYNVGGANFAKSTLLARLNTGDYESAAAQLGRWVYAKRKKLPGLVDCRRQEERLFRAGTALEVGNRT